MRSRKGFTLLELLVVLVLVGIAGGLATVEVNRSMRRTSVQRAASVVAQDLRQAFSLAARQRRPVEIVVDPTNRIISVRDAVTPALIYSERRFGEGTEQRIETLTASQNTVRVFPNGIAAMAPNTSMTITVSWGARTRTVTMTRAGMVRMSGT